MTVFEPTPRKLRHVGILAFAKTAYRLAKRVVPEFSSKFSKRTYTQPQHVAMLCLKVRDAETYDGTVDKINEMPAVKEALELEKVPDASTLCKAFDRLLAAVWRVLLELTRRFFRLSGIAGMDSSGEERAQASKYYTRRAKLHIKELKVTFLVDVGNKAVLDVHMTTTRRHDTKIGTKVVKRSAELMGVLIGDKGFDDEKFRRLCRELGIRPLIKHREFRPIQKAWNARMKKELYNQRNQCESVRSSISRKYGSFVRSKKWFKQFREELVKHLVYNIDRFLQLRLQ